MTDTITKMIDKEKTIKMFGYDPNMLSHGSDKQIVAICEGCDVERIIKKRGYRALCRSCVAKNRSDEWHRKQSEAHMGQAVSDETRRKLSEMRMGHVVTVETREKIAAAHRGKPKSPEHKQKLSDAHRGKTLSAEHRKKIGDAQRGKIIPEEVRIKYRNANMGEKNPSYGTTHSDEQRQRISATLQGIPYDEWEGYAKDHIYCPKFDERCRESNRDKYNRECFICGKREEDNLTKAKKVRKLSVHHVDLNKAQGCDGHTWKLIPVCLTCHPTLHTDVWEARIRYLLTHL